MVVCYGGSQWWFAVAGLWWWFTMMVHSLSTSCYIFALSLCLGWFTLLFSDVKLLSYFSLSLKGYFI